MSAPLLVSGDWLESHLGDPGIRVADVRWSLLEKDKGRNAYLEAHIPGAVFFDIDTDLASPRGQGPGRHPLPRPEIFAATLAGAGISSDTHVAYDFGDGSTAARLWWLLRYLGHERVSLLDGGMAHWVADGRRVESHVPAYPKGSISPRPRTELRVDAEAVVRLLGDPRVLILDARAAERYEGKLEPVDPVAGHIPGARNRPYAANVRSAVDPRFVEIPALREEFEGLGAGRAVHVVCYCGSGVNACQELFALELAGFEGAQLYEGSWSDWCSEPSRAVRLGPEPVPDELR